VSCTKKSPEAVASAPQPSASATHAAAAPQPREVAATPDVCTLLTAEEISTVQGEAFKAEKPSSSSQPGLSFSQCYFELPTAVNSVVLTIMRKAEGADARDPKESWDEIFHREKPREKD